ncbi:MAG: hypothetical protein IKE76_09530 [Clostridia bacterium]|nr:hypothetical protein [Clostridia bacterium]
MIVKIDGIPVFDAVLAEDGDGMRRISLVDRPAVSSDFVKLAEQVEQKPVQMYAIQDEDKRLVRGVVMRADYPIYRRDAKAGEYYIVYKADTIREMAQKYLADGLQNAVDLQHDGKDVSGVEMVQYFIKDTAAGVNPAGFEDIADGSLFAEFKILDDDIWAAVKDGTYNGFSLEGYFTLVPNENVDEVQEIVDALEAIGAYFNKQDKQMKKTKFGRVLQALAKVLVEFANTNTDRGIVYWEGEEDLKEGDALFIEDADGQRSAAPDGEYRTDDGKVITVAGGVVSSIVDPEAEVAENEAQEFGSVNTDKGALYWDGEEDLKAGDAVYTGEGEERAAAADGEYVTEDGKTIVVVDGKVSEIRDPEAEVAPEDGEQAAEVQAEEEKHAEEVEAAKHVKCSESFDEKAQKIVDALLAVRGEGDWWMMEAGEDFAIVEEWSEEGSKDFRYPVSWNEDETASVGDPIEVKHIWAPLDAADPFAEDPRDAQLAALTAEVERLKAEPKGKSAHEEFAGAPLATTGEQRLDNLRRIVSAKR